MKNFAVIEDDIIINVIVANSQKDAEEATGLQVIESIEYKPWIHWKLENNEWVAPQPFASWIWNSDLKEWGAPIPKPEGTNHIWSWNEENGSWDALPFPQPYPSWVLNENQIWTPPVPKPEDDKPYAWDEESQSWILNFIPE